MDRNKFGGIYAVNIQNDCQQYADCQDNKGTPVKDGWYENCVDQEARQLNEHPEQQMMFLTKITRCALRMNCDYYACVTNPPVMSYGMGQIDKLNYLCQAKSQCAGEMGNPVDNQQLWNANCAGVYVGTLDNWSTTQRSEFESTFAGCSTYGSCQFLGCFPF